MKKLVKKLLKEESGQGMAEYGLILALVAVACIAAFITLGDKINKNIEFLNDKFDAPSTGEETGGGTT